MDLHVSLPGGLFGADFVRQDAVLQEITGRLEERLQQCVEETSEGPARVSAVLGEALQSVGGQPADRDLAASLCVADRQFLMMCLAQMIDGDQVWMSASCTSCAAPFDMLLTRSALPVQSAGAGFPTATVWLNDRETRFRVATGADQEALLSLGEEHALRHLLSACLQSFSGGGSSDELINDLSGDDIAAIEAALETVAPTVCTTLQTRCPECDEAQSFPLNPYSLAGQQSSDLYRDVHSLASHYHWSESQILDLPRERRQLYLRYVAADLGVSHGES